MVKKERSRGWFICLITILISGHFQAISRAQEQDAPAKPKLVLPESSFDFGTITAGAKVEHEYVVKNEGSGALTIQRVVAACGCTTSSVVPATLAPETEGKIKLEFDSTGFSGKVQKAARVYSDDPENPISVVTLQGVISEEVNIEPQSLFFESVPKNSIDTMVRDVTVKVNPQSGTEVQAVKTYSRFLKLSEVNKSGSQSTFQVRFSEDVPVGEFRDRIIVELKGSKRAAINIPVFASIKGPISFIPPVLSFGLVSGTEVITRRAKLEIVGEPDITPTGVESDNVAVTGKITPIEEGKAFWVDVMVDPTKVDRDLRASVKVLTSNAPKHQEISISVYGALPPKVGS